MYSVTFWRRGDVGSALRCCHALMAVCSHVLFFKQKTAYELRISDWSSDVCSSDLGDRGGGGVPGLGPDAGDRADDPQARRVAAAYARGDARREIGRAACRERVGQYV